MRSELFIEYMRLKKDMAVVGVEPVFLQGISRENGSAIIRHGIKTDEGYFMNSNGTVENVFKENEIIRIVKENDVYAGRENLFIRFTVKPDDPIYYEDGALFGMAKHLNVAGVLPRNILIPDKKIILPFNFLVTDLLLRENHEDNDFRLDISIMGEYAYKRNAHYTYQDFGVPTEEVFTEDAVQAKNTWHMAQVNARMKFNTDPGGDGHVRILKNDRR